MSLLEALRKYLTFKKLRYVLQGKRDAASLKLAYVPPILEEGQEARIEIHEFDVKVFFSLPKFGSRICGDVEKQKKMGKLLSQISRDYNTLKMAFNAIRYNTPLPFYHREIIDLNVDAESRIEELIEIVEEVENSKEILAGENSLVVRREAVDSNNIGNMFFALAMLSSVVEFWRRKIGEPEVNEIVKTFEELYKNLELEVNSRFLERDTDEIKEKAKNLVGERLLSEFYESGGSKDRKRNFFAHSGFLREITKVKKEGEKILLSYDLEVAKKLGVDVRSWLRDPS